jgi:hypothetical protein
MQPWATLILAGAKQYETRSWRTQHRGLLAIHASRTFTPQVQRLCARKPFRAALQAAGFHGSRELPRGMVLGTVELVDVLAITDLDLGRLSPTELAFGDFQPHRFAWRLAQPRWLEQPLLVPGQLGLFEIPLSP